MASNKINRAVVFLGTGWIACAACAGELRRVESFADGQRMASDAGLHHWVFVHGAPWQKLGERILEDLGAVSGNDQAIPEDVIFTSIAIAQEPTDEENKAFESRHAGWNGKSYSTLPALQLYAPDGQMLLNMQGRALRDVAATGESMVAFLGETLTQAMMRRDLLATIERAHAEDDRDAVFENLDALFSLPFSTGPSCLEKLKHFDPEDRLGWQARMDFKPWDSHLREITKRIQDGQAEEVIAEMDSRLAAGFATPHQQALLLGGKGMAHAKLDQLPAAAAAFRKALAVAPDDPLARAIHRHGIRIAGNAMDEKDPE